MLRIQKDFFRSKKLTVLLGFTSRSLTVLIAFVLTFLVAIALAIYFFFQYQKAQYQLNKVTQGGEQALISEVGKLIILPRDEKPSIATVSDVTKLKGQHFFSNAKNGDKVLLYTKAQQAILYDPFVNKIVAVGPISLTNVSSAQPQSIGLGHMRVAIYNGTTLAGLATMVGKELVKDVPDITLVAKTDAQKSTYTTTILVDLTGKNATQTAYLAQKLKGKVGLLPSGEIKPSNADLLVILGK